MSFGFSVGDFLKLYETGMGVYKKCRDCPGEYKTLANEARQLTNVLQDLADKVEQGKIPESKVPQLLSAYEGSVEVLSELDATLNHYASLDTKSKRAWDRLTWDSDKSKTLRGRLTSSVGMLNGFWNSLIHDNQLLIIEALGRLEKDYAGGHREESRASVERLASASNRHSATLEDDEEDEEDMAWPQIIRDLEDVGVSQKDALEYRDFIIDWFVRAVNEGRLMERSVQEEEPLGGSFSHDLQLVLPQVEAVDHLHKMPSWETPSFPPPKITRRPVGAPPVRAKPDLVAEESSRQPGKFPQSSSPSISSPLMGTRPSPAASPRPSTESSAQLERNPSRERDHLPVPVYNPQLSSQVSQSSLSGMSANSEANPSVIPSPPTSLYQVPSIVLPDTQSSSIPAFPQSEGNDSEPPVIVQQAAIPLVSSLQAHSPAQTLVAPPPAYDQLRHSTDSNILWTAQLIVSSWNGSDYIAAEKHLENQLAAVQRGEKILVQNRIVQPTERLLMHLIGVSASYNGNFLKAKSFFEGIMRGPYTGGANLDDGDIAAARWLGDTCLHLNEPENAGLAWAVALDGLLVRYGISRIVTRQVLDECRMLDSCLKGLTNLANSFSRFNHDSSSIYKTTTHVDKSRLISWALDRIKEVHGTSLKSHAQPYQPSQSYQPPSSVTMRRIFRSRIEWKIAEGFLIQPLISQSSWPLQYDPFFSPYDAITLLSRIASNTFSLDGTNQQSFAYSAVPTVGLGGSKHLDYVTRNDVRWLVSALMTGLKAYGIEAKEKGTMIFCRISQVRFKFAYFEAIGIQVKKLPLRSVWGIKVTEPLHATRGMYTGTAKTNMLSLNKDSAGFRDIVKSILESAENEEKMKEAGIAVSEVPVEGTAAYSGRRFETGPKVSYG